MLNNRAVAFVSILALHSFLCCAEEMVQPQRIVNCHTAGVLARGAFAFECSIYPNGSLDSPGAGALFGVSMGCLDRLTIGVSYGADGIIGRESPVFNPHVGALVKYRIFEETYYWPAFAVGYDHQGLGGIDNDYIGYIFKSPGFFLALSKNYLILTKVQIGLHAGINYSQEESRVVKWPNGYVGMDLGINDELSLVGEYDLALNARDPDPAVIQYNNPFRGFLSAGIRWAYSKSLYLEFFFKDILQNKMVFLPEERVVGWDRELKITYIRHF
jgi:hypothetical protein